MYLARSKFGRCQKKKKLENLSLVTSVFQSNIKKRSINYWIYGSTGMTPLTYLKNYVHVTKSRLWVYNRVFEMHSNGEEFMKAQVNQRLIRIKLNRIFPIHTCTKYNIILLGIETFSCSYRYHWKRVHQGRRKFVFYSIFGSRKYWNSDRLSNMVWSQRFLWTNFLYRYCFSFYTLLFISIRDSRKNFTRQTLET